MLMRVVGFDEEGVAEIFENEEDAASWSVFTMVAHMAWHWSKIRIYKQNSEGTWEFVEEIMDTNSPIF